MPRSARTIKTSSIKSAKTASYVNAKRKQMPYDKAAWKKLRRHQLSIEPLCRMCDEHGVTTSADSVDHIMPVEQGGSFFAYSNLQSLCRSCHSRKTARDKQRAAEGVAPPQQGGGGHQISVP